MQRPRKRFGQHFLSDQAIIHRIVAALAPAPHDHLIEIGPGQGALTLPVLKLVKHLDVVELDRDLVPELERRTKNTGELTIYSCDALEFDFASVKLDERKLRVFGNLPYNISTPLIFHLLTFSSVISDMLFMLQKEVAERLAAETDSEHYGRLSVMAQYHCQIELLFDVPAQAFFPPPQVKSSMVKLIPYVKPPYLANDYQLFSDIVRLAFGQRRKTLRNSLKTLMNDSAWEKVSVHSDRRAEELSVKEFVEISNVLCKG